MKKICIGDVYQIQCYKHNGKIHRAWDEAVVLDIKKDYIVFGNNKTLVTGSLEELINEYKNGAIMFSSKKNMEYGNIYRELTKNIKSSNI